MMRPSAWPSKTRAYISGVAFVESVCASAMRHQHGRRGRDQLAGQRELALYHLLHEREELADRVEAEIGVRAVDRDFHVPVAAGDVLAFGAPLAHLAPGIEVAVVLDRVLHVQALELHVRAIGRALGV